MYRINLHPEFAAGKQAAKRRLALTGLGVTLLGAEALLVGGLLLSAHLLEERAEAARASTARLEAQVPALPADEAADLALARALLDLRSRRIDWAPQLAAISERIGPQLVLSSLKGRSAGQNAGAELEMEGLFRGERTDLESATHFVDALRADERMAGALPRCALENVSEAPRPGFTVVCRPAEATP